MYWSQSLLLLNIHSFLPFFICPSILFSKLAGYSWSLLWLFAMSFTIPLLTQLNSGVSTQPCLKKTNLSLIMTLVTFKIAIHQPTQWNSSLSLHLIAPMLIPLLPTKALSQDRQWKKYSECIQSTGNIASWSRSNSKILCTLLNTWNKVWSRPSWEIVNVHFNILS